ncbi:MAG TPA: trans-aconitate 2-methyltransferase [Rhizomicrobium sp.]|jgi:trans-aconitate 2-methyltransferase|nr:trans-aconitate 2-methyltransferase [Rhizomicrobium sp.]
MTWNPHTYLAFADERTRPAAELLARIPDETPEHVIDLGCGPGNSTALLAARWPHARLEGLDSSPAMLGQAHGSGIAAHWIEADVATWTPKEPYDVVFSNATLQWLGDHPALLPRLMRAVKRGGTFAFQVPHNMDAPSHALMRETAAQGPWASKLRDVREVAVLQPDDYYAILKPHAHSVDIWETEYLQVLTGDDAVYHWVSGTGLRPFVQALSEGEERDAFIAAYKKKLSNAYPRRDGTTLFPFKRLFAVARHS